MRASENESTDALVSGPRFVWFGEPTKNPWPEGASIARSRFRGIGVSPGVVTGKAFIYRDLLELAALPRGNSASEVSAEANRIDQAVEEVIHHLEDTARQVENEIDAEHAAIFQAHAEMLRSNSIRQQFHNELQHELLSAEQAVKRVLQRIERRFHESAEQTLHDRADDIADITGQLLASLAGIHVRLLETLPEGSILVAKRLLPSDTVALSRNRIAGVVLEHAGITSHASLLARELGIPAVGQIPNVTDQVRAGELLIVDGFSGEVLVGPSELAHAEFQTRRASFTSSILARPIRTPAIAPDGSPVTVLANVGSADDARAALRFGADGIGLFRTEFLYLGRKEAPSEEELYAALIDALGPFSEKPIILRLLDIGGDKLPPFLRLPLEPDPALGRRGVRMFRDLPQLLTCQLRTFLRIAAVHDVRILIPMVTLARDVQWIREMTLEASRELRLDKVPPVGAMIEVPAAALCSELLAEHADFFSIGTNDLTQYTMAAARENSLVADYYIEDHTAVVRLVEMAVRGVGRKPISVCGEAAARPGLLRSLLALGIRTLSVAPPAVPFVKQAISNGRLE
jgi:phosphotransferase system enzyme I (PtsI)